MPKQESVTRLIIAVVALVTIAVACGASPHVDMVEAAAGQSRRPARRSSPAPQEPHDAIHRVIELWLDRKDDEARELIEETLAGRSIDGETRATLHNLAARLQWLEVRRPLAGRLRMEALTRAEYRAAIALGSSPMNFPLWRDYLAIATEIRGRKRIDKALTRWWKYGGSVQTTYMFRTEEERVIARATLQVIDGRYRTAISQLRNFISRQPRDPCSARVVLAQVLGDAGQLQPAIRTISEASPSCRQNMFVARLEGALDEAREIKAEAAESSELTPAGLRKTIIVRGEKPFEHRADLENLILQNPARLDRWYELWRLLHQFTNDRTNREYQKVVDLARRIRPSLDIDVADIHGQVARGEFRKALEATDRLLEKRPGDPFLHAVRLLCGAARGGGQSAHRGDLEVVKREVAISSCLRYEQVQYCLGRDSRCVLGAMVRRGADHFSAAAYLHGWPYHSPADQPAYANWLADEEEAERLDGMKRLRALMLANDRRQERQLAALGSRIEMVVQSQIDELRKQVDGVKRNQAWFEREVRKAQARTNTELTQLAAHVEKNVSILYRQTALTDDQVRALSLRVAANYKALAAVDVDQFGKLFEQYLRARPGEANIVFFNILNQLQGAKAADQDVAAVFADINDQCLRWEAPSPTCLREIARLVKRYLEVELPLAPGMVSLDLISVHDTILELWEYLIRKLRLSAKP